MTDYNLIYVCKETGKEYPAKRTAIPSRYKLLDQETGEVFEYGGTRLRELFRSSKNNRTAAKKVYMAPSKVPFSSKAYRDYLSGVEV